MTQTLRLLILALLWSYSSYSQNGTLDTTFGTDGITITDFFNGTDYPLAIAQQTDNKFIVTGLVEDGSEQFHALTRYTENGILDTTFGDDGKILIDYDSSYNGFNQVKIQSDGNILVSGRVSNNEVIISRFSNTGDADTSFGTNGTIYINTLFDDVNFFAVKLLDNDQVLVYGHTNTNNQFTLNMTRLMPDGTIDTTFGTNGLSQNTFTETLTTIDNVTVQDTGDIIITASKFEASASKYKLALYKCLNDGSIDTSFGGNGSIFTDELGSYFNSETQIAPNNNIIIMYSAVDVTTNSYQSYLMRFTPNGTEDTSFGTNGKLAFAQEAFEPTTIIVEANSNIVVGGNIFNNDGDKSFSMHSYKGDGTLQNSFSAQDAAEFEATDILLQDDNKLVSIGFTPWYEGDEDFALVRFNEETLSTNENAATNTMIYPNPSKGIINISNIEPNSYFTITDIAGKIIKTGLLDPQNAAIDLSIYQHGIYFLTVNNTTKRLIKY